MNALTSTDLLSSKSISPADDATIIALSQQLLAGERRIADWDAGRCEITDEEASALTLKTGRQATLLMEMRPASLAALCAKTEAVQLSFKNMVVDEPGETIESMGQYPHLLAWSIFEDVRRLAAPSPDAALIAACEGFLRIDREFSAFCAAREDEELERAEQEGMAMLAPQKALAEQIVAMRATTAEGHLARLRIIAFGLLPKNSQCRDVPGAAMVDRFQAATLRDVVHAERGGEA